MMEESMKVDDDKIETMLTSLAAVTKARRVMLLSSFPHLIKQVLTSGKAAEGLETDGKLVNK